MLRTCESVRPVAAHLQEDSAAHLLLGILNGINAVSAASLPIADSMLAGSITMSL
jgi:hypothetical protein